MNIAHGVLAKVLVDLSTSELETIIRKAVEQLINYEADAKTKQPGQNQQAIDTANAIITAGRMITTDREKFKYRTEQAIAPWCGMGANSLG